MENYFTLSEAAERLSVSHEAVRRLCHRGTLEHVRFKGRMLVKREAIAKRLASREKAGGRK